MILEQSFSVQIAHIHRTVFELCVRERKKKKRERKKEEEQNGNFHFQFSRLLEELIELLEYIYIRIDKGFHL